MGNIIPILVNECIPGDQYSISCDAMVRFAPMLAPIMHRVDVSMHYFFVPNRIIWSNWEKFIVDASDEAPVYPSIEWTEGETATYGKFADYMGLPPVPAGGTSTDINALPFAAYQCIYNEYYRDQNLIAPVDYKLVDGDNTSNISALMELRKRAWEHDYFTASLPFAQKGTAVDIPIGQIENDVAVKWDSTASADEFINAAQTNGGTGSNWSFVGKDSPQNYDGNSNLFAQTSGIDIQPGRQRKQPWLHERLRE